MNLDRLVTAARTACRTAGAAIWAGFAELLQSAALLAGWLLITKGVADLTTPKVWSVSIGLLLLSLCGWSWLRTFFTRGLYTLTRKPTHG